jgi:hypothetical protein
VIRRFVSTALTGLLVAINTSLMRKCGGRAPRFFAGGLEPLALWMAAHEARTDFLVR